MFYKTLLIDDEKLAINRLKRLLSEYTNIFEILGEAYNGKEALEKIENLKPDLIFLDIEMPVMTGFEMLSKLNFMPLVIFATAFDEYAIRAFEENSVDYLLKPIEAERLAVTVSKLKKLNAESQSFSFPPNMLQLIEQLKPKKALNSISVKIGDRILIIRLDEITYFEAEDKYVNLHTSDDKKHLIDYSLTFLEEKLPSNFSRVSRSVIVNTNFVKEIQKYFNGKFILILKNKIQTKITSGLSYADNVKALFEL